MSESPGSLWEDYRGQRPTMRVQHKCKGPEVGSFRISKGTNEARAE